MAVKPVAHPIDQCLHCKKSVVDNLTITTCDHIYHKTCLTDWFTRKKTCPIDQGDLSPELCKPLQVSFSMDSAEDEKFVSSTLPKNLDDEVEKVCSICTEEFAVYFIQENKRFMHQACWIELHPDKKESPPPSWYPQQIATMERKWIESGRPSKLPLPAPLPSLQQPLSAALPALHSNAMGPAGSPRVPSKPISPLALVLLAIAPVVSLWAYMMNTRIYKNSNPLLFVLSIPVLITLKILFFASFFFKRIFTERKA